MSQQGFKPCASSKSLIFKSSVILNCLLTFFFVWCGNIKILKKKTQKQSNVTLHPFGVIQLGRMKYLG
jgi:hypothetical protein